MSRTLIPSRSIKPLLDMPQLRVHCEQRAAAGDAEQTVQILLGMLDSLVMRHQRQMEHLALLARERFGSSSERVSAGQLVLALADSSLIPQAQESHSQVVTEDPPVAPPRRHKRPTRKLVAGQLPSHLPRIPNISEPTPEEPHVRNKPPVQGRKQRKGVT